MERYYQPEIECASREQILAWQNERLVKQVKYVYDRVPYYRKKMEEKGVTPADVTSVADLHKLPFLTKQCGFNPHRVRRDAEWWLFIPSTIWIYGKTAVQEPLWPQAERRMMWSMFRMDMGYLLAGPDCMAAATRWGP